MRHSGALLAIVLLGGCTGSSLLLLPDEGGAQGAVAVLDPRTEETRAVVSEGNTRSRLGAQRASTRRIAPDRIGRADRLLLASLPPPPRTFILYFEEGTTRLTPASQPMLAMLRAEVVSRDGVEVQVTGHTDRVGSDGDNDVLSTRRAEEIKTVLAGEGVPEGVMVAVGQGERRPLVQTDNGVEEPRNRRVEVTVR